MTVKEFIKKYEWILIPLLLVLVSFYGGTKYGEKRTLSSMEVKSDTVTKVVTVYKDFPDPVETAQIGYISVPIYKFLTDTVNTVETAYLHDTTIVYLPREQKYYEEENGSLRLWVSGYDPRLDRYELDKVETYITNTVKEPLPKFVLGVVGGFGAMFPEKTVSYFPYIELDATYSITQRWSIGISGGYEAPIVESKIVPSPFVKISGKFSILRL